MADVPASSHRRGQARRYIAWVAGFAVAGVPPELPNRFGLSTVLVLQFFPSLSHVAVVWVLLPRIVQLNSPVAVLICQTAFAGGMALQSASVFPGTGGFASAGPPTRPINKAAVSSVRASVPAAVQAWRSCPSSSSLPQRPTSGASPARTRTRSQGRCQDSSPYEALRLCPRTCTSTRTRERRGSCHPVPRSRFPKPRFEW